MARWLALVLLVTSLGVGSVAAPAMATRTPKERTVEAPYRTPVVGAAIGSENKAYFFDCLNQIGCAIVPLKAKDRFARLEIVDAAGGDVYGSVYVMPGGAHLLDFCGATESRLHVRGLKELLVHVISGVCPGESTPTVATTGVVRATLTKGTR